MLLVSRAAMGSTANNNCGDINHLCGLTTSYPTAASCYDMYMVRFDGAAETWAAKLTDTSPTSPAYGTGATAGGNVIFIWSESGPARVKVTGRLFPRRSYAHGA